MGKKRFYDWDRFALEVFTNEVEVEVEVDDKGEVEVASTVVIFSLTTSTCATTADVPQSKIMTWWLSELTSKISELAPFLMLFNGFHSTHLTPL